MLTTVSDQKSSGMRMEHRHTVAHQTHARSFKMPTNPIESAAADGQAADTLFVRMPLVTRMTGLGRSTIYRLMAENKFPSPVKLAKRAVAWRRVDLERWGQNRPSTNR
jgi:prophage regulatory protein